MSIEQKNGLPSVERTGETPERRDQRVRKSLMERARTFSPALQGAMAILLGFESISGISQADVQETEDTARIAHMSPERRQDLRMNRVQEVVGQDLADRVRAHHRYDDWAGQQRRSIERASERTNFVHGFEQMGYDDAAIESVLRQILPKEWLSQQNLTEIRVVAGHHALPSEYGMNDAEAHAICLMSRGPQGSSPIEVYAGSYEALREPHRSRALLGTLIHEIAHANSPEGSMTQSRNQREEEADWNAQRVRIMEHAPYTLGHMRASHWVSQVGHMADRWLGDRWAYPQVGEGYLPEVYPLKIHGQTQEVTNAFRLREHHAETFSQVIVSELPDEAFVSDEAWDTHVAIRLIAGTDRILDTTQRIGREFEDALEYVRHVHRAIPDLRARSWALQRILRRGHLFQADQNPPPSWPESR